MNGVLTLTKTVYFYMFLFLRGFINQSTAELMMKRAERHKKLRRESQKRIRLSDPSERLAMFRRSQGHDVPVKPVSSESKTDSAFQLVVM